MVCIMLKVTTKVSLTTEFFIQTNKLRTLLSGEMLRIAKEENILGCGD